MYVMPEVVNAQLQAFQSELRRVTAELGRQRLLCGASESENRYAWLVGGLWSAVRYGSRAGATRQAEVVANRFLLRHCSLERAQARAPACNFHSSQTADFLRVRERSMRAEPGHVTASYVSG